LHFVGIEDEPPVGLLDQGGSGDADGHDGRDGPGSGGIAALPADVPAPVEERAPRRPDRPGWTRLEVVFDNIAIGEIVFNGFNMNAHCFHDGHQTTTCHTDRLLKEGRRPGQGRPLGMLTAWLLRCHKHSSKKSHQEIKQILMSRVGYTERRDARIWLKNQGRFQTAFALERPKRDGEDSEPELAA
jgi:hypothetical protein